MIRSLIQHRLITLVLALGFMTELSAQQPVYETFRDTRVINAHSVEVVPFRKMDVRISHRFGDMFGADGGWPTLYGIENAADILFAFDFGVSDHTTVGISRTKGAGPLQKLVNGTVKINLTQQTDNGETPFTTTILGQISGSTMARSTSPEDLNYFDHFLERFVFHTQIMVARRFSSRLSLQLSTGYTYRNLVPTDDINGLISLGLIGRIQIARRMAFLVDFTQPISTLRKPENGFYQPLGFGLEFDTGGHIFQINVTNAKGIIEADYIPYTYSNWGDGQFRLGFTINRLFNL